MLAKLHPNNETRLSVLHGLGVLDSGAEKVYDDITALTADLCDIPICLISLVEEDRQWFKSEVGLGICETTLEESICSHAILQNDYLEIEDTRLDPRTVDNPLCLSDKPIRFYAGAILRTLEGWPLGTLCVLDYKPRKLNNIQQRVLKVHAQSVTRQLELTRALIERVEDANFSSTANDKNDLFEEVRVKYETLTPREKEILHLIAGHSGSLSSKQIGRKLTISHRTVDHHRASILAKMRVESVAELIAIGLKSGILK